VTGLRQWVRDPELPARSGQPHLAPPQENEIASIVCEHALLPDNEPPTEILWEYARWKPGVSITCTYQLRWDDGHAQTLVAKRYADDKVTHLAERKDKSSDLQPLSPRVRPRVLLPDASLSLWCPAADRELPGVAYLLDIKRFASLVKNSGITEPGLIRRRKSEYEALRYKAERRAVFRAKLRLRDEAKTRITLAARVLPIEEAQRIATSRKALETAFDETGTEPFIPRLRGFHERYGILIEQWLDVRKAHESNDFTHAKEAGAVLARLHALPLGADGEWLAPITQGTGADLRPLFTLSVDLAERYQGLHEPRPQRLTWIHGDFHPDQVATIQNGEHTFTGLLDLDCLGPGDPTADLANWIADHLFEDETMGFDAAATPLLEGYQSAGGTFDPQHLRRCTADELVRRGAAAIRRLEAGAMERAARCLARAALSPG